MNKSKQEELSNPTANELPEHEFKCNRCGRCCGLTPFTRDDYKRVRRKAEKLHVTFIKQTVKGNTVYFVKKIVEHVQRAGGLNKVDPKNIVCPFLETDDNKKTSCKIYDDRPVLCRMFGDEGWRGMSLFCPHQNSGTKKA